MEASDSFKEELGAAIAKAPVIELYPSIPLTRDLILKIADLLKRHVFFKDPRLPLLIATWVLGTYVHDLFTFFGYLWANSPEKRCGKSLLLEILSRLCHNATSRISNLTESVIFHLTHKGKTLIVDELESLGKQDKERYGAVMSVLNAGFQAGSKVYRMQRSETGFEEREFNAFSPKALAGISKVTDTIEDRSFKIAMVRKAPGEHVERFNLRKQGGELEALREAITLWARDGREAIGDIYDCIEEIPGLASLDDRLKDISEPLAAIALYADAELLDGQARILPKLVSVLQTMAKKRSDVERQEAIAAFALIAEEILGGEQEVFIPSIKLLERVHGIESLSWIDSARRLANFLNPFDIVSAPTWITEDGKRKQVRGYMVTSAWVEEIKTRYLSHIPPVDVSQVSQTHAQSGPEALF